MSDSTFSLLNEQRQSVALLRAKLQHESAKLEGMEALAASLNVVPRAVAFGPRAHADVKPSNVTTGRPGRQAGAISKRWRAVFDHMVAVGNRASDRDVTAIVAKLESRTMRPKDVRRLFEGYQTNGFIVFNDDSTFSVSEAAIGKFGLTGKVEASHAETWEASNSNGRVAELEEPENSEQHPFRKGENVGSSPTPPAPFRRPEESATSLTVSTSTPTPPWKWQSGV